LVFAVDNFKFLLAELHRAQHQGFKTLEISTIELSELLAKVESLEARAANEFNGKHLGYATGHKLKSMLSGARKYLTVSAYKTENFDTEVTIPEMGK
jgi:hypothetical protein